MFSKANQKQALTIAAFTLIVCLLLPAGVSQAFCIHNKSDRPWYADQVQGDSVRNPFAPKIRPGNEKCCDWDDKDCNRAGSRHARVVFDVKSTLSSSGSAKIVCSGVTISADGEFTIRGSGGNYYCQIH